jgi:DNA-binding Lrp family transcriptional regulator
MDKKIQEDILQSVRKGETYASQVKKYEKKNISYGMVRDLCIRNNVKSRLSSINDDDILKSIKKMKVATLKQIADDLGVSLTAISKRVVNLVSKENIKRKRLTSQKAKATKKDVFKKYTNKYLYYAHDDDLREWIIEKIPVNMPSNIRRSITNKLRNNLGIDFDLPSSKKKKLKTISIPESDYEVLKKKAEKLNVPIRELVTGKVRKNGK